MSPAAIDNIMEAYRFGASAHEGQKRVSGAPYISHPVAVATILAEQRMDAQTIIAAILHDVIEDTATEKAQLEEQFGEEVADLVDGVSKLDQLQFHSRQQAQAESFRKMLLAMAEDIRVIMIKLADRTHNMRTLGSMPPVKRRRIARETLDIYAPIANRLGINSIRLELEDLGFRSLYPYRYRVIEKTLKKALSHHKQLVKKISQRLSDALDELKIIADVGGREKHMYSIYRKMRHKGRPLSEIVDMFGFRIIVDDVDTCYRVLGMVHRLYKPMPGRFKDYIAIPRINGYQSLHTTLFGPDGIPLEVQIRTIDMDRVAESGIAAHWLYKSDDSSNESANASAREWLARLVELDHGADSEEFLENVRVDLFPDKVYVFTPRGDIMRLPMGSTSVDFAYAVHTDVGNRCVAAKVDRRMVPLRTPLLNGQTVEIITAKGARPNPAWVNFVATAKARSAIRQYLKNLKRGEAIDLGKRLLGHAMGEFDKKIRNASTREMKVLLGELNLPDQKSLYEEIGLGKHLAPLIARRLVGHAEGTAKKDPAPLAIEGTEGVVVSYARCCYPVPGDSIIGFLSSGKGIVIHRDTCGNLTEYRKQPDKWISVNWKENVQRQSMVELRADVNNKTGVLAAVAANIAETHSNIDSVSVVERDEKTVTLIFHLQVRDRVQLAQVMRSIRGMPDVISVSRSCA
ncbi:MAG: bifunctional (p)ppGpp synthetase/guanosine-3',5'-bis(diphosphate) 3'-pyrophosphohydrolase [Proteobacteria bacterium]|nr:bifunctional (p)ppGpp synthetase/guanosine-3',5'-bis(diphosphate) 3'-pyrophosphohydrolase [Pseudomonadota bacterium]MCH8219788.1 bifunctional (p)ppGpp synthetase/guanosine-3',5'-bis(diphosphate) 3'-pyrophosphohydrolase [Pseudomonadota bacterium]MCH8929440.1 bifunctional (p)ppGpp synthetase/guanosine-3',5'-bis(diphosphate) 3'-pyrophosphohydrolase [Pseudomonadota bacterium]